MYAQVQLLYNPATDNFFVADQVFVKWETVNGVESIADLLVVENKLQFGTALTTHQRAGRLAASLDVRSVRQQVESTAPNRLPNTSAPDLTQARTGLAPSEWFKIFDSETGDVISGVANLPVPPTP